jgi:VanZ family protein
VATATTHRFRISACALFVLMVLVSAGAYIGGLPRVLERIPHGDLLGHALLFGLLAVLVDGALGHRPLWRGARFPRLAPVIVIAVAGLEELAQGLSPRRSSSLSDFAADVAGVCLCAGLAGWIRVNRTAVPCARG